MECPNGWLECDVCKHKKECFAGDYKGEETADVVVKAAEVAKKVVDAEVVRSVERIRGRSWSEEFNSMSYNDRMKEVGRYPTPCLHTVVDPYKAEPGAFVPGGGGKVKTKKDTKGHKPTLYKWGEFK